MARSNPGEFSRNVVPRCWTKSISGRLKTIIFIQTCEKNCAAITTRRSRMTLGPEGGSILAVLGKGSRREYERPQWCELALIGSHRRCSGFGRAETPRAPLASGLAFHHPMSPATAQAALPRATIPPQVTPETGYPADPPWTGPPDCRAWMSFPVTPRRCDHARRRERPAPQDPADPPRGPTGKGRRAPRPPCCPVHRR